jgi:peptidoglycan-associated lipoprotein
MSQRRGHLHLLLPLLVLTLLITGCPKRPATTAASAPAPTGSAMTPSAPGTSPSMAAPATPGAPAPTTPSPAAPSTAAPATPPPPSEFSETSNLKDVYFDFDKYDIRPDSAKILDANATWLKANPGNLLLIEGHCDERGTAEYNLALGERRAKSTMNYLVGQGVAASRVTVISYGKERPVCTEHNEACWSKNRRDSFLAKKK